MATIKESCVVNSSRSSSNENVFRCYRTFDTLGDITIGSEFQIPNNYVVKEHPVIIDGTPIRDHTGNQVFTQYIECQDSMGKTIEFYPASLVQIAFAVDPKTGKDVTENRIHRADGPLVEYIKRKRGENMNQIMEQLKGCTVKLLKLEIVFVRKYGIDNDKATQADVETRKIGTWTIVGEKRPDGWIE